jgi:hypothetical protein
MHTQKKKSLNGLRQIRRFENAAAKYSTRAVADETYVRVTVTPRVWLDYGLLNNCAGRRCRLAATIAVIIFLLSLYLLTKLAIM